jgi:hypothetical protein
MPLRLSLRLRFLAVLAVVATAAATVAGSNPAAAAPSLTGLCRAYQAAVAQSHGNGHVDPLHGRAFDQLIAAAGGVDEVGAYCDALLGTGDGGGTGGGTVATPTFAPSSGTYTSAQSVTIADATAGASIYYTTDGTTPTSASPVYSGSFTVAATTTVQAIAIADGVGTSAIATATYTITEPVCPAQSDVPDFGSNVHIFDPSMSSASIQAELDAQFEQMKSTTTAQFSDNRVADLYMPGTYNVEDNVGYYTSVAGLGQNPDDVTINGDVTVDAFNASDQGMALQNFWRSAENLAINPSSGSDRWAVAQAAPFRRIDVHGGLQLYPASYGFASGGYIADTAVSGQVSSVSQQQWYTRDSSFGSWAGGVWNMVFSGTTGAPANTFPTPPETTLATTPVSRDVPYLYVDSTGKFRVFLPALRTDASGPSWAAGSTPGTSLPMSRFYVVKAGDTATTINNALSQGCNLFVTPGIYHLDQTINVTRPDTVVLGIGYPTFVPDGGVDAMHVADVDGVRLKGLLFDAGTTNSAALLTVGTAGSSTSHTSDPTTIQDVFFRIGGEIAGKATTSLIVNSNDTIIDHIWAWRADHGNAGTVGWTVNTADTGLIVNGDNVEATGLFVEHFQKYEVIWNGENGKTIFFQNEMPYDAPDQSAWQHDGVNGYAAYKVADTVATHEAWGLGSYIYTNVDPTLHSARAFEVPDVPGVVMHDLLTVSLNKAGTIDHVINDTGAQVTPTFSGPVNVVRYPATTVDTPVFTPAAGSYDGAQSVTITDTTDGASIYYTTDGSTPTAASTLYTGAIQVSATTTINAIGVRAGLDDSAVASATFTIAPPDFTQSVTQTGASTARVTFTPINSSAFVDIHYIVDGGGQQNVRMANTGNVWTQDITGLAAGDTVEYWFTYAVAVGQKDSAHFTYTQGSSATAVATPVFTPAAGSYDGAQSVTIADTTDGASIYYTTDGSTPTSSSTLYVGPIDVAATTTINAYAVKAGSADSVVASATYTIGSTPVGDFTQSVTQTGPSTATVTFTPTASSAYVDIHYIVNGGGQQNVRMANSGNTWTLDLTGLAAGDTVEYWFTYAIAVGQKDSAHFSYTQGA